MWLNFAGEMYMEMNGVKEICVFGFLGINSWIDIRKKQVSLLLIIIFSVCGTVWTIYSRRNVPEVLMCVGTGFLFVLISILTEGAGCLWHWGQCCTRKNFFQHFLWE